jgi:hypothetical protein
MGCTGRSSNAVTLSTHTEASRRSLVAADRRPAGLTESTTRRCWANQCWVRLVLGPKVTRAIGREGDPLTSSYSRLPITSKASTTTSVPAGLVELPSPVHSILTL